MLCLKRGGMQAKVDPAWFANCSSRFLKPTIEIVNPKAVVTLGERAYRAVACSYGIKPLPFRAAVEHEGGFELPGGVRLFPVYHCGARTLNTHRPMQRQVEDWRDWARVLSQHLIRIFRVVHSPC